MILTDATDAAWRAAGPRLAVAGDGGDVTYGQLLSASEALSALLAPRVRPGHAVVVLLPNSAAFVVAFFATARVGGIVAPLDVRLQVPELLRHLRVIRPAAVIVGDGAPKAVLDAVTEDEGHAAIVCVDGALGASLRRSGERHAGASRSTVPAPLLQLQTSGSTGTPKSVVRSHEAVASEVRTLVETLAVTDGDRFLGVVPFCHVNGLIRTMLTSMMTGATLYPLAEFNRRRVLSALAAHRITVFGAVPHVFVLLAHAPSSPDAWPALRVLFSASAPLLAEDNRRFAARHGRFVRQLYGSTETGTISYNDDLEPERDLASVGRPLRGVKVEIRDAAGRPVAAGAEGEVAIASPYAATGYAGGPAEAEASFRDGWYLPKDLGRMDADGRLTLIGRTAFVINHGGFKVNPNEVEAVILEHPSVREAAVLGMPGAHGDEDVWCFAVARGACTPAEIQAHCLARLASYKVPARVKFLTALPRSAAGKVLRRSLADRAGRVQ